MLAVCCTKQAAHFEVDVIVVLVKTVKPKGLAFLNALLQLRNVGSLDLALWPQVVLRAFHTCCARLLLLGSQEMSCNVALVHRSARFDPTGH